MADDRWSQSWKTTYWSYDHEAVRFKYKWHLILPMAAKIVTEYNERGLGVTLRQLFYRLVAAEALPNTTRAYNSLSTQTARYRRKGRFPALIDQGRSIHRPLSWPTAKAASDWLTRHFRVDRAVGQEYLIYIAAEKHGMHGQLSAWFGNEKGIPIITLGGYASQTLKDDVVDDVWRRADGRETVLIYAGDFDASGEDIPRDFVDRTDCWDHVMHVALNPDQVEEFKLPPQPGKEQDARSKGFAEKYEDLFQKVYGMDLVQIELDALPPETLQKVFADELAKWWQDAPFLDRQREEAAEGYRVEALHSMQPGVRRPARLQALRLATYGRASCPSCRVEMRLEAKERGDVDAGETIGDAYICPSCYAMDWLTPEEAPDA